MIPARQMERMGEDQTQTRSPVLQGHQKQSLEVLGGEADGVSVTKMNSAALPEPGGQTEPLMDTVLKTHRNNITLCCKQLQRSNPGRINAFSFLSELCVPVHMEQAHLSAPANRFSFHSSLIHMSHSLSCTKLIFLSAHLKESHGD